VPQARQLSVFGLPGFEPDQAAPSVASLDEGGSTARARLARDLHDGVGQSITALLVQIRAALAVGEGTPAVLQILEGEAQEALHSLRRLAYGLRQGPSSEPLDDARQYAERLVEPAGITLEWIDERLNPRLPFRVSNPLAWSIRESISNAVTHGGARTIEVRLLDSRQWTRVTIRDNGIGFSPQNIRPTPDGRGLGLAGNAERMAEIGGHFSVRSRPGEGAVVLLRAPRQLHRPAPIQLLSAVPSIIDAVQGAVQAV